ncbi:MAG: protein phosphatase 2C domain-containing protein [Pseudomonadota bacterium]|nr:protein phosphatase 2C domain-containing protein [Pseudomonadota bacterium]
MLYYDHFYTIGKTHAVCEDYAMQGEKPVPFMVVCDGCSSSRHTDIGARILALTTRYILENTNNWPLDYTHFGQMLINKAWDVTRKMHLDSSSVLDATVMLAFLDQQQIQVYVYGDGCLLFKDHHGQLGYIDINFTHNAPYYLTYWYDEQRGQEYAQYDEKPLFLIDSVNGRCEPISFRTPLCFQFPLAQYQQIAIASDGASQCIDTLNNIKLPLAEVAKQLLAFEHLEGEFVKAHLQKTLDHYAQHGIYPADDLSIGVFVQR